jgi:hypothetical protein
MMGYGYGYGFMGGGGWLLMVAFAALLVIPFWRILPRSGVPSWVALVAIIPIGALILLWIVAFKDRVSGASDGA